MSFLTAEYDYDMDIQVNREEAFEDGVQQGLEQGEDRKAVTDILNLMDSLKCDEERAMELLKIPKDKWQEFKSKLTSENYYRIRNE